MLAVTFSCCISCYIGCCVSYFIPLCQQFLVLTWHDTSVSKCEHQIAKTEVNTRMARKRLGCLSSQLGRFAHVGRVTSYDHAEGCAAFRES